MHNKAELKGHLFASRVGHWEEMPAAHSWLSDFAQAYKMDGATKAPKMVHGQLTIDEVMARISPPLLNNASPTFVYYLCEDVHGK